MPVALEPPLVTDDLTDLRALLDDWFPCTARIALPEDSPLCGKPAAWLLTCRRCSSFVAYACQRHGAELRKRAALLPGVTVSCCMAYGHLDDVILYSPISH